MIWCVSASLTKIKSSLEHPGVLRGPDWRTTAKVWSGKHPGNGRCGEGHGRCRRTCRNVGVYSTVAKIDRYPVGENRLFNRLAVHQTRCRIIKGFMVALSPETCQNICATNVASCLDILVTDFPKEFTEYIRI